MGPRGDRAEGGGLGQHPSQVKRAGGRLRAGFGWPNSETPAKRLQFAFRADLEGQMAEVKYKIVEHDGGWAYKLGDVFS